MAAGVVDHVWTLKDLLLLRLAFSLHLSASVEKMSDSEQGHERRDPAVESYSERHHRIKNERRGFLTTLTGLSGGAIVLSISFLEKIAPSKHYRGMVITAWCFFGVTILISVFGSLGMIFRSQQYQRELRRLQRSQRSQWIEAYRGARVSRDADEGCSGCFLLPEYWAGFFFVFGVLMLTAFAIANLIEK